MTTRAFADLVEVLDQALASSKGLRVTFADAPAAWRFRSRCNSYRMQDRKDAKKIYPPEHVNHGRSAYDVLILRIEGNEMVVEKERERTVVKIEEIE